MLAKEEEAAAWANAIAIAIADATAGTANANAATTGKRKVVQFAKRRLARWGMGKDARNFFVKGQASGSVPDAMTAQQIHLRRLAPRRAPRRNGEASEPEQMTVRI